MSDRDDLGPHTQFVFGSYGVRLLNANNEQHTFLLFGLRVVGENDRKTNGQVWPTTAGLTKQTQAAIRGAGHGIPWPTEAFMAHEIVTCTDLGVDSPFCSTFRF